MGRRDCASSSQRLCFCVRVCVLFTMFFIVVLLKAIARHVLQDDSLSALMNGPIQKKLGSTIPENVTWGGEQQELYFVF